MPGGEKKFNSSKQEYPQRGINNMDIDRTDRSWRSSGPVITTAGPDHNNIFHYMEQHALHFLCCVKLVCLHPSPAIAQQLVAALCLNSVSESKSTAPIPWNALV